MEMVSTEQHFIHPTIMDTVESTFTVLPAMPHMPRLIGTIVPMELELEWGIETSELATSPMELQCFKLHTTDD